MFVASALKYDEVLFILPDGRHIVITVTDIRGIRVFLGFDAPDDIEIHREAHIERVVIGGRIVRTVRPLAIKKQKIHADESNIGLRVIDPLGVAEAYEEAVQEGMIDHA